MPTISVFFGIAIRMFFSDHPPPHFHVAYQRYRAVIAIEHDQAGVTEVAFTPESRELQVMHTPMSGPKLDEPEA